MCVTWVTRGCPFLWFQLHQWTFRDLASGQDWWGREDSWDNTHWNQTLIVMEGHSRKVNFCDPHHPFTPLTAKAHFLLLSQTHTHPKHKHPHIFSPNLFSWFSSTYFLTCCKGKLITSFWVCRAIYLFSIRTEVGPRATLSNETSMYHNETYEYFHFPFWC